MVSLPSVRVLRVGHRFVRDDRTLTHLCLTSRALGAEAIYLEEVEPDIARSISRVNATWGGDFQVIEEKSWRDVIRKAKKEARTVVHLTMYGVPIQEKVSELRKSKKLLVVVGGPKVPREVYFAADYNIAVTSQPHSETAALAIALHEIQNGEELKKDFGKSTLRIIPKDRGKRVIRS
ncbi:MAG: tRNA (cytidine(56)-2'-O)-methyltransferase [Thaumarchaeota archaeon]|nr:tRNA (cytidine(56)-2'-O)-methyltransferase [Nitrososphaerota archaeon]